MSGCKSYDIKNGRFVCDATEYAACEGVECAFFKTAEEHKAQIQSKYARFRTMTDDEQEKISETYYDGKMPWKE